MLCSTTSPTLFDQTVRYAKATGTFDEGVTDIKALAIRVARPASVVHRDRVTGAETILYSDSSKDGTTASAKASGDKGDKTESKKSEKKPSNK